MGEGERHSEGGREQGTGAGWGFDRGKGRGGGIRRLNWVEKGVQGREKRQGKVLRTFEGVQE